MTPQRETAARFFSALYGDEYSLTIKMISDKAGDDGKKKTFPPDFGSFDHIWKAVDYGNTHGYGAFYTPNYSGLKSTADKDVQYSQALFIDIDDGHFPEYFALAPSAIMRRSDGGGYHIYWFISKTSDMERWTGAQKVLIDFYKSDRSIHNPARLMRIPGTVNHKREKPEIYEIQELNDNRYTLDAVVYAHTDKAELAKIAYQRAKGVFGGEKMTDGEGRHKAMIRAAFVLNDYGLTGEDMKATLGKVNKNCLADPYTDKELEQFFSASKYASGSVGEKAVDDAIRDAAKREQVREAVQDYVYIRAMARFYHKRNLDRPISVDGFNAKFAAVVGQNNAAGFVFKHQLIEQFEGLAYEPGKPELLDRADGVDLNIYEPPTCAEDDQTPDWFLSHLEYLIPNEKERDHILNYLAFLIQNPGAKVLHACLLVGKQGTGKSLLQKVFEQIFGASNVVAPHNENLCGQFTGWAKRGIIVFINELSQIDRKDFNNKIKPFITEDKIEIREMYQAPYTITNHINIIAMSNHENPLFLDRDDRRWFVVHSPAKQKHPQYYNQLVKDIAEKSGQVLHYLRNRDISLFNPGERPAMTEAKAEIIQYNVSDLENWVIDGIECKEAPFESDFVTLQDVKDALPYTLKNSYATSNRIGKILRDNGAVRVEGTVRTGDKTRRFWIIRNAEKYNTRDAMLQAIEAEYGKSADELTFTA